MRAWQDSHVHMLILCVLTTFLALLWLCPRCVILSNKLHYSFQYSFHWCKLQGLDINYEKGIVTRFWTLCSRYWTISHLHFAECAWYIYKLLKHKFCHWCLDHHQISMFGYYQAVTLSRHEQLSTCGTISTKHGNKQLSWKSIVWTHYDHLLNKH